MGTPYPNQGCGDNAIWEIAGADGVRMALALEVTWKLKVGDSRAAHGKITEVDEDPAR